MAFAFGPGVSIASAWRLCPILWAKITSHANAVCAGGLILIASALMLARHDYSLAHATLAYPLLNLGFGCLMIAGLSPSGFFSSLRFPGAEWGATLAFSFYLTHKQMIHLSHEWLLAAGVAPSSRLYPSGILLACLVASATLYFLIERPFLNLRDRWLLRLSHSSYRMSAVNDRTDRMTDRFISSN
jgi:peptidoglycan/LPS O-acetylase OafA/YrhL